MEWRDTGILLSSKAHGENSAILEVLTHKHGRHLGILRGGTSRKIAPHLQPGAQLDVTWKARLEEHMGSFSIEPLRSRAADAMAGRLSLAGLNAVTAMAAYVLPERLPCQSIFSATEQVLDLLTQMDVWPLAYLRWEQGLLEELGYGLDLGHCAVTGRTDGLIYISPRSGAAVSAEGAGDWAPKLLQLPPILRGEGNGSPDEILSALNVTGYFLDKHMTTDRKKSLPAAREALITRLQKASQ